MRYLIIITIMLISACTNERQAARNERLSQITLECVNEMMKLHPGDLKVGEGCKHDKTCVYLVIDQMRIDCLNRKLSESK